MVKPFKPKGKKTYLFEVMINGKRVKESTKETNFNKAQKAANQRTAELREGTDYRIQLIRLTESLNCLPEEKKVEALQDCVKFLFNERSAKIELQEVLPEFMGKPGIAPKSKNTINSYKRVWKALIKWLENSHPEIKYAHEVTEKIAANFLKHIWSTNIAEQTYNEYIKILRRIFNVLSKDIGTTENVWNSTKKVKINSVSKKPLTLEEFTSILEVTEKEINSYMRAWGTFTEWLEDSHPEIKYAHEINKEITSSFLKHIRSTSTTEQDCNECIRISSRILGILSSEVGTSENVCNSTNKVKNNNASKKPLTLEEFCSILMASVKEIRHLLIIGFYTGLRLGDACLLKWDEINLQTKTFSIEPRKTKAHKKTSETPIHSVLHMILESIHPSKNKYVLPKIAASYKKDPGAVSKKIQKTFVKAGIKTTEKRERGVRDATVYGFHSLRHSFISFCAAKGIPQHVVRAMVGHSSDAIHQIYQHADTEQKRKAIDTLPKIKDNENNE